MHHKRKSQPEARHHDGDGDSRIYAGHRAPGEEGGRRRAGVRVCLSRARFSHWTPGSAGDALMVRDKRARGRSLSAAACPACLAATDRQFIVPRRGLRLPFLFPLVTAQPRGCGVETGRGREARAKRSGARAIESFCGGCTHSVQQVRECRADLSTSIKATNSHVRKTSR